MLFLQDYVRDLEKEEEEQKKRQKVFLGICAFLRFFLIMFALILISVFFSHIKEQLRRAERKNRDAFRKMMEEHITAGTLTAKTCWRDYCQKVHFISFYS